MPEVIRASRLTGPSAFLGAEFFELSSIYFSLVSERMDTGRDLSTYANAWTYKSDKGE
jgi:hypothetical protein